MCGSELVLTSPNLHVVVLGPVVVIIKTSKLHQQSGISSALLLTVSSVVARTQGELVPAVVLFLLSPVCGVRTNFSISYLVMLPVCHYRSAKSEYLNYVIHDPSPGHLI